MDLIFNFLFKCLNSISNFLDFKLPGLNLTYLDFILLAILIPVLFSFVKGTFVNVGTPFGFFTSSSSEIKYSRHLFEKYFEKSKTPNSNKKNNNNNDKEVS